MNRDSQLTDENQSLEEKLAELQDEIDRLRRQQRLQAVKQEETVDRLHKRISIEEELKESQERFVTVFEKSLLANKIINTDLKMVEINQALCSMLGYSRNEILGSTILEYTRPDFKKRWYDLHEALWKKELPSFQLEACLIAKDKREVWVLVNTISFKDKGETLGYTSLQDITDRKKLERHKDEFISTVSHELKTPLTSIKSYSQMLLRYFSKLEDEKPRDMLMRMDSKVNSLTTLIKDLVMASKIGGGKLNPRSEEYAIDKLVSQVVEDYQKTITRRRIVITKSEPLSTKGDNFKVEQVIQNLLTNAIKFSNEDTEIHVSLGRRGNEANVCIQDFGRGIASENIEKIFERFYKVKEAESNTESGMGLGLYICREIIASQQGKLWLTSEIGKGSIFCFSLPLID